jgi:hypothetical protein
VLRRENRDQQGADPNAGRELAFTRSRSNFGAPLKGLKEVP